MAKGVFRWAASESDEIARTAGDFDMVVAAQHDIDETREQYDALDALADDADKLYGRCRGITSGRIEIAADTVLADLPAAVTQDASNYESNVWTRSEFSCALHEPTTAREAL